MSADPVTVKRRYYNSSLPLPRLAPFAVLAVFWFVYDENKHILWFWWLTYAGVAALVLVSFYVVSHTSLTYSPTFLTKRLAGRKRTLDLTQLKTAGVEVGARGEQSETVTGLFLEDRQGTRMTLSLEQPYPNVSQWASYVRAALQSSDAVIGEGVMSTLEKLTPKV